MLKLSLTIAAAAVAAVTFAQTPPPSGEPRRPRRPAASSPVLRSTDKREAIVQQCIAEARTRLASQGITEVTLKEVQDTDLFDEGRASTRMKVQVTKTDSKGKTSKDNATIGCKSLSGVVNEFNYDD